LRQPNVIALSIYLKNDQISKVWYLKHL